MREGSAKNQNRPFLCQPLESLGLQDPQSRLPFHSFDSFLGDERSPQATRWFVESAGMQILEIENVQLDPQCPT